MENLELVHLGNFKALTRLEVKSNQAKISFVNRRNTIPKYPDLQTHDHILCSNCSDHKKIHQLSDKR